MSVPDLTLTGERTLPGIWHENYWFRRHEAAYLAVAPLVAQARVLEAGSGEGYGAALLAERGAKVVIAVDADPSAAVHAGRSYPGIRSLRADLLRLPLPADAVDVVVGLQVVEHLHDQEAFITEAARVLRPRGLLALSTPNRLTFSPGGDQPRNPFHTRELCPSELLDLTGPVFETRTLRGVAHGERLVAWERENGSLTFAQLAGGPPESWPGELATAVRGVTADDFRVDDPDLEHCLDLLLIARRR